MCDAVPLRNWVCGTPTMQLSETPSWNWYICTVAWRKISLINVLHIFSRPSPSQLLPPESEDGVDSSEERGVVFDIAKEVISALGVSTVPPDAVADVLLHPDAPPAWSRAVALQLFNFIRSIQMDKERGGGVSIWVDGEQSAGQSSLLTLSEVLLVLLFFQSRGTSGTSRVLLV
jgi:hypothetical protein